MDDVLILGSGIAGSMLAATLAKKGLAVRMIDSEAHPRFAIGEATTPDTSFRLKLLALRSGVPEIAALSSFDRLRDSIGPAHGVKRSFSFVYHRPGERQQPLESHQYPTMAPPMGPDCHLFRQDTDAWMMATAVRYGAKIHQRCQVKEIQLDHQGARVETADGLSLRARFLVDAAGFRSPLARQLNLREGAKPLRTNSRTVFSHMVGVPAYDRFTPGVRQMGLHYPLCQSTLHHVFPGGWMWVIPFNNHPDQVNPLCSVGLTYNRALHPETGQSGEAELRAFLEQYPSVKDHLGGAVAVRPWVSTGRLQYSTTRIAGDRWALMAHSAAFIDALYSSGLNLTVALVDRYTQHLSDACAEDRFDRDRFAETERRFFDNLDVTDRVVANSFRSFQDFDLWDAWYRVWVIGLLLGGGVNGNLYMQLVEGRTPDPVTLEAGTGILGSGLPSGRVFLDDCFAAFEALDQGQSAAEVAQRIRQIIGASPCSPPFWRWSDPSVRATPPFTLWWMWRLLSHYRAQGPDDLRAGICDWKVPTAFRYLWAQAQDQQRRVAGRGRKFLWESMFSSDNRLPPDLAPPP